MERLGKSFILVLEPLEFNVYEKKMNYDTLGFVFGTQSTWLRDQMYQLVTQYLEFWQHHFTPKAINEIRDNISNFIASEVRREEVMFRFYCALGLLAYYTARTRDKGLAMRKFTTIDGPNPTYTMHYIYIGVNDYSISEIRDKIGEKIAHSEAGLEWKGFCFELIQVPV